MRTRPARRHRLRLAAALAVITVVAASTTGHALLNGASSVPSLGFIGKQVARVNAALAAEAKGGKPGAAGEASTPMSLSVSYGGTSDDLANFLSLGGFASGTADWSSVIGDDFLAQFDAPGAGCAGGCEGGASIDGTLLASNDTTGDVFAGGQGGGSVSGGGAGDGFGGNAPFSLGGGGAGFGSGGPSGGGSLGSGSSGGASDAGSGGGGAANVPSVTAPVPEPSTYLMLLGGLAAMGSLLRRRRDAMR